MFKKLALFLISLLIIGFVLTLLPIKIEPVAWMPETAPELSGDWQPNNRLASAIPEQTNIDGPDTVIVGPDGYRYSAINGGIIMRWKKESSSSDENNIEEFVKIDGRPVGMNFGPNGNLYAADETRGVIWKITPEKEVSIIAETFKGRKFNLLNDVWIGKDGSVYFTESTSRWPLEENQRALIEHGGDGGIFVMKPDGNIEQLLDRLNFANGLLLSQDEDFLLVAETGAYQITRLWLKGPDTGKRDVLLSNLPGFVGDLSIAPDGKSYWSSFFTPRKRIMDTLAPYPKIRKLLGLLPLSLLPQSEPFPFVFRFDAQGNILETLQAVPDLQSDKLNTLPSFSSVVQHDDYLLLGTPGGVGAIDSDMVYRVKL